MASLLTSLLLVTVAVGKASATPATKARPCVQLEIPVKLSTTATRWLQTKVDNNVDAVDWIEDMTAWSSRNMTERIVGNVTINDTFKISGQLCVPPRGAKSDVLQIATHGVGFDKRYWDAEVKPDEYSYVNAVLSEGYSIFTYDRIGTGASDKPDAYDVAQTTVQVEILRQLTSLARSGKLVTSSRKMKDGSSTTGLDSYTPSKIVHVGHSFGSILTIGLLTADGAASDGAILTGFLYNDQLGGASVATWGFEFARESDPHRFRDRPSGYIVQATKSNTQLSFFKKGSFEPALLEYAWKIRQPNTVSEFVSIGQALYQPAADFKGPLKFFIGEHDYGFCRGDCNGAYNVTAVKDDLYPAAADVSVHIQPGTGHGLALSTNATAGYKVMFDYLHTFSL